MTDLSPAVGHADVEIARALFLEYARSLAVDLEYQGFSAELATLPGPYSPPGGALLIARADGEPVGCVAVRRLTDHVCEMKRLFVRPQHRGTGAGLELVRAAIQAARDLGYRELWLDTLPSMTRAHDLYRALGFVEIPPYGDNAAEGSKFFGLEL